jgi:protein TonB
MICCGQLARRLAVAALFVVAPLSAGAALGASSAQGRSDAERLRAQLARQLADIEEQFAKLRNRRQLPPPAWDSPTLPPASGAPVPPYDDSPRYRPPAPRVNSADWLPAWQAELARRFDRAAATVEEILKRDPPDADHWRERLETLTLYAQPVSSPDARDIFGASEVSKRARVLEAPAAEPTAEARAAKAKGDVRLRLVLAADGTVKHVFPVRSRGRGLTEAAVEAARRIRFKPAVRGGRPVSQFITLVYDFKGTKPAKPYVPRTIF